MGCADGNQRPVVEPSKQEYDDWVSNLNLGGSPLASQAAIQQDAEKFMSMPDEEEDKDLFDFDSALGIAGDETDVDDLFASGPFSAPSTPVPTGPLEEHSKTPAAPMKSAKTPPPTKAADPLLDSLEDGGAIEGAAFASDFDDSELEKLDASEFFSYIPKEISPTRLPGTRENYPIVVVLGLLIVLALNIGAVAFLVMKITSG
jgi:hypothetical protein